MGSISSRSRSKRKERDSYKADRNAKAGYFLISYKIERGKETKEKVVTDSSKETKTLTNANNEKQASVQKSKPKKIVPVRKKMLDTELASGFGKFGTMFTKKSDQDNGIKNGNVETKDAPVESKRPVDITFVYHYPKGKININPYDKCLRGYGVSERKVSTTENIPFVKYMMNNYGRKQNKVDNNDTTIPVD